MDVLVDLLFALFRELFVPLLLPVFMFAGLVMITGGRVDAVFKRSFFLILSFLRFCFRIALEIIVIATTKAPPISRSPRRKSFFVRHDDE